MKLRSFLLACALAAPVMADEGLWLFDQFPKALVKQKYNVDVTDQFLENLRLATMRIGGGTGSFVSPQGLLVTNHHVAAGCVAKLGTPQHDYLKDGFYAASQQDEARCPELDASVLVSMEDVTKQVKDAATEKMKPADALQKRNAAIARIEKDCAAKTGNTCAVVKLFSGERYDLYQYKKYSDVRLVFAPELASAGFGGNAFELTYPRYSLDAAFLRAYENGAPAATPHYFKWSDEEVKENDLVFSTGSPISTARLATAAQLTFYHDVALRYTLARLQTRVEDLRAFGAKSADNQKLAQLALTSLSTDYKLAAGKYIGLSDEWLTIRKTNFEKKLRNAVERDPKLGTEAAKVWDEVAAAYKSWTPYERQYQTLENPAAQGSNLFRVARSIVRSQPDTFESLAPVDDGVEIVLIARYLEDLKALGEKEAPLKALLAGKSPQQAAEAFVHASKLKDPAERKRLVADHDAALKSDDGMIRLARLLEEPAQKVLKKRAETIDALETSAAERIAQFRYKLFGATDYPDATATPRVAFGVVKSYNDRAEGYVPYATTFGGLYHLAIGQEPLKPPQRWIDAKPSLGLVVPMDFVSTADITSGASGSPVVNAKGEIVGITFDGNLESIAITYLYDDDKARAVHVATQGIVEALQKVYKTPRLLHELGVSATQP